MSKSYATEKLLLKVLGDLKEFLPFLVLVGGWIPHVYARYIWRSSGNLAVTTSDIDFGVPDKKYNGKGNIASKVQQLGYGERHLKMDRLYPFVPVAKLNNGSERAEVEFITPLNAAKHIKENLLAGIKLNEIEYFELLLSSIITVDVNNYKVQVPADSMFVFHKLLTFALRKNELKFSKDLYYAYYMLRFCPDKDRLIEDVKKIFLSENEANIVTKNIKAYFNNIDSKGPILIENENGPDDFVSNVREDAYNRILQLLN